MSDDESERGSREGWDEAKTNVGEWPAGPITTRCRLDAESAFDADVKRARAFARSHGVVLLHLAAITVVQYRSNSLSPSLSPLYIDGYLTRYDPSKADAPSPYIHIIPL